MPRRHRRTHRSHESSAWIPTLESQLRNLQEASSGLFEIVSNLSERVTHLAESLRELAELAGEALPPAFRERAAQLMKRQEDLAKGLSQGATELLDGDPDDETVESSSVPPFEPKLD